MARDKKRNNKRIDANYYSGLGPSLLTTPIQGVTVTGGPDMSKILAGAQTNLASAGSSNALGGLKSIGGGAGGYLGAASTAAELIGSTAANLKVPEAHNKVITASDNESFMQQISSDTGVQLGRTNALGSAASGALKGAQAGMAFGPWGAAIGGAIGGLSNGITTLIGNDKKKHAEERLELERKSNYNSIANGIFNHSADMQLANYSALGGNLFGDGGTIPKKELDRIKQYNINHPAPPNTTSEILNGRANPDAEGLISVDHNVLYPIMGIAGSLRYGVPAVEGMYKGFDLYKGTKTLAERTAARNNKVIKNTALQLINPFSEGGDMNNNEYTNGIVPFNTGGTHEQNPNGGIPQGIGANGLPNLVEEGEVKYNDYIYSNRLRPGTKLLKDLGIHEKYAGKTFGSIAKELSKESKERPNDPISKNGLDDSMNKLMMAQEAVKMKRQQRQQSKQQMVIPEQQMMALGGNLFAFGDPLNLGWTSKSNMPNDYRLYRPEMVTTGKAPYVQKSADDYMNFISKGNYIPQTGNPSKFIDTSKPVSKVATSTKKSSSFNMPDFKFDASNLRYAPAVGSGIMALTDAMGLTNKADYTAANAIAASKVKGERLHNYETYKPFDNNFYLNKLGSNAAATREGLANSSGGNRATYQAGLLAADYNYGQNMGDLARKAEEYNLAQRHQVNEFNKGVNMFNAQQSNWEQGINSEINIKSALARQQAKEGAEAARAANYSNFLNNLGGIGKEEAAFNMIKGNPANNYFLDHAFNTVYKGTNSKKYGGKISKKKGC